MLRRSHPLHSFFLSNQNACSLQVTMPSAFDATLCKNYFQTCSIFNWCIFFSEAHRIVAPMRDWKSSDRLSEVEWGRKKNDEHRRRSPMAKRCSDAKDFASNAVGFNWQLKSRKISNIVCASIASRWINGQLHKMHRLSIYNLLRNSTWTNDATVSCAHLLIKRFTACVRTRTRRTQSANNLYLPDTTIHHKLISLGRVDVCFVGLMWSGAAAKNAIGGNMSHIPY